MTSRLQERVYEALVEEDDARVCDDIPESACREVPGSFVRLLASYVLTKLGDALASPKTVLPWVCTAVGAPPYVAGMLVPLRESGSMLPQIVIGHFVRRLPVRKWVWVAGSLLQAVAVAGLGVVALTLRGAAAGWAILGCVGLFSLSRGLASVSSKDVLGKTIPKTRRGRVTGWSSSAAGLISIGVGLAALAPQLGQADASTYGSLLLVVGVLWVAAAFVYAGIAEKPGATDGGRDGVREAFRSFAILRDDGPFRRFLITRALLMASALSAPFYVALAQERLGSPTWLLGAFVAAAGAASLVSGPIWGRFADRSSRWVMVTAAVGTCVVGLVVAGFSWGEVTLVGTVWFFPAAYFLLSVAHAGVRVGRKTYVVDLGSGNRRTDYVAVGNTVIGVLLLVVGAVGALVPWIGQAGVVALLAAMAAVGALVGTSLPST